MTERYVSEGCEDLVDRLEHIADVTQGLGYHNQGDLRCRVVDTGNGYIARFPANCSVRQDYYVCLDYAQARDLVLALSTFRKELGFK